MHEASLYVSASIIADDSLCSPDFDGALHCLNDALALDRANGDSIMEAVTLHCIGCTKLRIAGEDLRLKQQAGFEIPMATQQLVAALNTRMEHSLALLQVWLRIYEAHLWLSSPTSSAATSGLCPLLKGSSSLFSSPDEAALFECVKRANGLRERGDVKLFIGDLDGGCDDLTEVDNLLAKASSGLVQLLPPSPPVAADASPQAPTAAVRLSSFHSTLGNTTKGPVGLGGPILVAGCKDSFLYVSTWRSTLAVAAQRLSGFGDIDNPEEKAEVLKECVLPFSYFFFIVL
jgi:hypothetical protein